MRFGLQKLTLLDFPGQVACTVFSKGCNFACPFCHNASLVNGVGELPFSEQDIVDFWVYDNAYTVRDKMLTITIVNKM